jgi:hypothetical protein
VSFDAKTISPVNKLALYSVALRSSLVVVVEVLVITSLAIAHVVDVVDVVVQDSKCRMTACNSEPM